MSKTFKQDSPLETDMVYIVMPAYNEQDNIEQVIKDWYPIVETIGNGSRLVVINDGSTDSTYRIMQEMAMTRSSLVPLTKANGGHGPTVIHGYNYALECGADWIFQTDSDGQTNPAEFSAFWSLRDQYDIILGKRINRGDGRSRAFVEKVVCMLLRVYFGVKVEDANAPFRLMKGEVVGKYIDKLPKDYNLPNIMLTTYFSKYKENMIFKEITFNSRRGGTNSINVKSIMKIGFQALKDFRMFKKEME